ncbi:MAG: hypothetical protein ABR505_03475 [Actinomycetota bacterium]
MRLARRAAIGTIAALFALVPGLLIGSRAAAHEEQGLGALAVLDRITPELPDVEVFITHPSVPIITIRNASERLLAIEGAEGEPFLRIGRSVQLNASSSTAYRSLDPSSARALPPGVEAGKTPRWITVARRSTWSWLDPRITFLQGQSLEATWRIPARWGQTPVSIEGGWEALDGHGHFTTAIDITDHPEGLDIQFLFGNVPGVYVRNSTDRVLEVPGLQDEAFLRIGPRGVFANLLSPTYHFAGRHKPGRVPGSTDPSADPKWQRVSKKPIWAWLELRARLPARAQFRSVLGPERRTVLSWTTPMFLGDERIELTGDLDWIPAEPAAAAETEDGGINPLWVVVAAAWVGVGALAVQRLRARRNLGPSEAVRARS